MDIATTMLEIDQLDNRISDKSSPLPRLISTICENLNSHRTGNMALKTFIQAKTLQNTPNKTKSNSNTNN